MFKKIMIFAVIAVSAAAIFKFGKKKNMVSVS